jgi:hypothetical protein
VLAQDGNRLGDPAVLKMAVAIHEEEILPRLALAGPGFDLGHVDAIAARTLDAAYGEADAWCVKLVLIWLPSRRNVTALALNSMESFRC